MFRLQGEAEASATLGCARRDRLRAAGGHARSLWQDPPQPTISRRAVGAAMCPAPSGTAGRLWPGHEPGCPPTRVPTGTA